MSLEVSSIVTADLGSNCARNHTIADCQFPIVDLKAVPDSFGNRKSAIGIPQCPPSSATNVS
jgi:hypothetical protein